MVSLSFLFLSQVFSFLIEVFPYPPSALLPSRWYSWLGVVSFQKEGESVFIFYTSGLLPCHCSSSTTPTSFPSVAVNSFSSIFFPLFPLLVISCNCYWNSFNHQFLLLILPVVVVMSQLKDKGKKIQWLLKKKKHQLFKSPSKGRDWQYWSLHTRLVSPLPGSPWALESFFNIAVIIMDSGSPVPKSTPEGCAPAFGKRPIIYN